MKNKHFLLLASLFVSCITFCFTSCGPTHAYMGVEQDYYYDGDGYNYGYYGNHHNHKPPHHKPPKYKKFKKNKPPKHHNGKSPKCHGHHHHDD